MSNTQLLQWLQSANGRIPSDAINRTAKSVWQTVSAPLKAMFAIGEDPSSPPTSVFLADAFRPTADGASSTIALRRGLALQLDSSIGDTWDGDVKPLYADTDQVVAFTQNTDASGDDRIDLVVIRPDVEEEEPATVSHKDTLEGPVYTKTVNTRRNLGFELDVIEGAPDAAPTAPATPSGWVAICKVTRPNGQAAVVSADVEDVRTREFGFLGALAVATVLWLGEPGGNRVKLEYDATEERLEVRTQDGDEADIDAGEVYGDTYLSARNTVRFGDRAVSDANRLKIAANSSLGPSRLTIEKGDGTIADLVFAKAIRAFGYYNFTGGELVEVYAEGLGATADVAAGSWTIALDPDLDSANAICLATFMNEGGAGRWLAGLPSTSEIALKCTDSGGTLSDPAAGARIAVIVIGGH